MCSHKTDIHNLGSEFYGNDQTIMIPFYVEYIPLIPNIIDRIEIVSHVLQR